MTDRQPNAEEVRRHVELLRHGLREELVTPLWQSEGKVSRYARSSVGAAGVAAGMSGNVYVSVAVLTGATAEKLGRSKRVRDELAAGLSGLAIDFDVIGTPDGRGGTKRVGAPDIESAIAASKLIAEPTLIVGSGGGVQPWHLFDVPLIFRSEEEREQAKLTCARWQEAHRQQSGFAIDSTHDLARLMRLAGTRNYKGRGAGVPVTIISDDGPRHSYAELAVMVADVQVAIVGGERQLAFNGRPPDERVQELIAQLCADPGFRSLWERDPDQFEGDSSRYDFRITARAIRAGLTDDEARAVGVANRLIHNPGDAKAEREDYWARTIAKAREGARSTAQATSDQPPRGERNYEIDFDPKGGLVLPDPPAVDDIGGHCRWLTAAFGLDRAHPITGGLRLGMRGDEGHVVLFRAGAEEIRFEPVKKINTPMRLVETLSWQTLPADSGTLSYKAVHCQRIAHVVRMLCGVSEQVTEAAEAEAILDTFLQSAVPVEGTTTYGPTQDRYAAALALRRPVDEATARPLGQPRYLIDAHSGELVVGVSDLESSARWHVGSTVARGWLLARMEAIGWQRIKLDGHEKAGRNDRGNHARIQAYRGRLREGAEDG